MSDIKLFHLKNDNVTELTGSAVKIERSLQEQIERNLDTYLGVRFLATEYSTGVNHGGNGMNNSGQNLVVNGHNNRYIINDMPIPLPVRTARSGWAFYFRGYE